MGGETYPSTAPGQAAAWHLPESPLLQPWHPRQPPDDRGQGRGGGQACGGEILCGIHPSHAWKALDRQAEKRPILPILLKALRHSDFCSDSLEPAQEKIVIPYEGKLAEKPVSPQWKIHDRKRRRADRKKLSSVSGLQETL